MNEWRVRGSYFEGCNCEAICPCRAVHGRPGGPSTYGECFGALSWIVEAGHADGLDLSGLSVVMTLRYFDNVQPTTRVGSRALRRRPGQHQSSSRRSPTSSSDAPAAPSPGCTALRSARCTPSAPAAHHPRTRRSSQADRRRRLRHRRERRRRLRHSTTFSAASRDSITPAPSSTAPASKPPIRSCASRYAASRHASFFTDFDLRLDARRPDRRRLTISTVQVGCARSIAQHRGVVFVP